MYTWNITQMEQNQFDTNAPTSPEALYSWSIRREDSKWTLSSGMDYREVQLLMQYFNVHTAAELVGKQFTSERNSAESALNLLLAQIRHGGNYTAPSHEDLRNRAAEALAAFRQPDFSDTDEETVFRAFREVWDGFRANEYWMASLKAQIAEMSNGQVELLDADAEDFPVHVKGPANYLRLRRGKEDQLVIMGPYSSPVDFIN
jgi:hypothetical protein